ncbi:MAG: M50 family metallopeptidase [Candidatus Nanoarchaeia archaeon]|nr:M50 family metallopeptidase [Candidatus Nanoarchaeia archaeon]
MLISLLEILYMSITILVIGYIFMSFLKVPDTDYFKKKRFDWKAFKLAILVAAPGVILHELAHKFVAMGFGYSATFEIFFFGLFLGLFLKWIKSPFLIIAPGAVVIPAMTIGWQTGIIAFAGPFVNLVLWLGSWLILNRARHLKRNTAIILLLTQKINMILFIFNMIPLGPFDGAKVLQGIISLF